MIRGCGIDLAEPARLRAACERRPRLAERLFTPAELADCRAHRDPWPSLAARFAAKEAFIKALGTGLRRGLAWKQIEVLRDAEGRPALALHGRAAEMLREAGATATHISLTHAASLAMAQVILEGGR